jgi:hypothetical protein
VSTLAIVEAGPGPISLDHLLGSERSGTGWALAAAAAGVGGSFAATEYAKRHAERLEEEQFTAVPFQPADAERKPAETAPGGDSA